MKRKKYEQRKQHFVPKCYLKAWLDPSAPKTSKNTPYVWLFDKEGKNPKPKAPKKIFRESEMYTLTARMHKTVLCTTDPLGFLTTDAPSTW